MRPIDADKLMQDIRNTINAWNEAVEIVKGGGVE